MSDQLLKIEFYVPETHLEQVKSAMFSAGAGRVGDYDCCAWQTLGQGQFRPQEGSTPFLGKHGQVERVNEFKVEMVCMQALQGAVIAALNSAHPYEEVAYCIIRIES